MSKFNFIPSGVPEFPKFEEVERQTRHFFATQKFRYSPELTRVAGAIYSQHPLEYVILANLVQVFMWVLDDEFVDNPKLGLEEKVKVLRDCIQVSEFFGEEPKSSFGAGNPKEGENEPVPGKLTFSRRQFPSLNRPIANTLYMILNRNWPSERLRRAEAQELTGYFLGCVQHLALGRMPLSIELYTRTRMDDSACRPAFLLLLLRFSKNDIDEALDYLETDLGQKAMLAANKNVSFVNDVLSVSKDKRENSFNYNIVKCWMDEKELNEKEAVDQVTNECNRLYAEVKELARCPILDGLLTWCEHSALWHLKAKRYVPG